MISYNRFDFSIFMFQNTNKIREMLLKMPSIVYLKPVKINKIIPFIDINQTNEYFTCKPSTFSNAVYNERFDNVALIKIDASIVYAYSMYEFFFFRRRLYLHCWFNGMKREQGFLIDECLQQFSCIKPNLISSCFTFSLLPVTIYSCFVRDCWFGVTHTHRQPLSKPASKIFCMIWWKLLCKGSV